MNCNICDSEIETDNGDVVGYFGVDQVSFCVWCMSCITDMVIQCQGFNDIGILKERIKDLEDAK